MAPASLDRAELVELASTPGCNSATGAATYSRFTISFKVNLSSTTGTQCIWCENEDHENVANLASGDRLTFEGKKLVLHLSETVPQRFEFQPIFTVGEEYDVAVTYDSESDRKRVVLFVNGDPVQGKVLSTAPSVSFHAGTFGCFNGVEDTNVLQVQGSNTIFDLTAGVPTFWEDWTTKQGLAVDAAQTFAEVVRGAEIWSGVTSSVTAEKALLDKLWTCRQQPQTYASYKAPGRTENRDMTRFDCDYVEDGPTSCEDEFADFEDDGNDMMTALYTTHGNCDIPEVVDANIVSQTKIGEVEEGRCDMGKQFLVMAVYATYVGAVDDMLPEVIGSNVNNILSFNVTTRSVKFNNGNMHIPELTSDMKTNNALFTWPTSSVDYTSSIATSQINLWSVGQNPNAFVSCLD